MSTPALTGSAEEGSIVLGWFTKLAIGLGLLGLLIFDGLALLTATVNAADHATHDASLAADNYKVTKNPQLAFNAAEAEAAASGESVDPKSFRVTAAGHVTLTVHKTANTLWMHSIGFLKKYTEVTGTGEGSPGS